MSPGPALAMPGKAQHFQGPQVSCCAKYLLFASNVLFWVGERERASESRPAETVGRRAGGVALAPLLPGRRGGQDERWSDWALAFHVRAVCSEVRGPGPGAGGRSLPSREQRRGAPLRLAAESCKGCSREAGARGVRMVPRRALSVTDSALESFGARTSLVPPSLSLPPGRCLNTGRCLAPSLCSYFSFSAVSSRIRKGFPIIKYVTFACLFFLTQQPFLLSPSSGGKSYYCI